LKRELRRCTFDSIDDFSLIHKKAFNQYIDIYHISQ
jgi:hypothetical protein